MLLYCNIYDAYMPELQAESPPPCLRVAARTWPSDPITCRRADCPPNVRADSRHRAATGPRAAAPSVLLQGRAPSLRCRTRRRILGDRGAAVARHAGHLAR